MVICSITLLILSSNDHEDLFSWVSFVLVTSRKQALVSRDNHCVWGLSNCQIVKGMRAPSLTFWARSGYFQAYISADFAREN